MVMDTMRIAICEDEREEYRTLVDAIYRSGRPCACERFSCGEELLASYAPGTYDLVFLDIYLPGISGVDVAARIRRVDPHVPMAFVTTSDEHALDGYRHHVARYVRKPYRNEEVSEAIDYAHQLRQVLPHIVLRVAGHDERIAIASILYLEQRNHTTHVHLIGAREHRLTGKLDDLERLLPTPPFYRCHKSYLVNLDHVERLDHKLCLFAMEEGGTAYIRRADLKDAVRTLESHLIQRTRLLGRQDSAGAAGAAIRLGG